jgi:thymidylate synthase
MEASGEKQYIELLSAILTQGDVRDTRNSITRSIFGERLVFDLKKGFPLLTTKQMFLRGIFEELMWFLRGETDSKILEGKKVNIWKENTSKEFLEKMNLPYQEGDVGNMYGYQLCHSGTSYQGCDQDYSGKGFNQIDYCLKLLREDKYSRRIIMSTFSPSDSDKGVLYPCHGIVIQFYVKETNGINYLSCHMYQRSADMFLGVPFNIASYALLTELICSTLNQERREDPTELLFFPDRLIMSFGDLHIYNSHIKQVEEQISREPLDPPKLSICCEKITSYKQFEWEHIHIENYQSHPRIIAKMIA